MKYQPLKNKLFIENRKRFIAQMKPNSAALFISNPEISVSADASYPFKQNPDFFWLTGIDQEKCALMLFPDCPDPKFREVLFVRPTNEHIAIWEGHKITKEEAINFSGIKYIKYLSEFENIFSNYLNFCNNIYLNTNEHGRRSSDFPYGDELFVKKVKSMFPLHEFERAAPILHKCRSIKNDLEIESMQIACNITAQAFERVCKFVKPGVKEYEIEAEIIHEFISNAANGHAYSPIIASGKNACILHYIDNNQTCNNGDLILMDFGANYGNYCADLTRTIPVSGKFTNRQKDVYNAVLKIMKTATEMLVPGEFIENYHKEMNKMVESELKGLGLITDKEIKNQSADKPAYKKYFMHGISHQIGLDVHDVGNRYLPFEAGMVLTVEPGIYIQEEGLGIRIENDVVIQKSGSPKDLMAHIPREIEEIEDLMNGNV